jgi:hypothetical protein
VFGVQVEWPDRVAAFRGLLEETLQMSKGHPEGGVASLATALVASELRESRVDTFKEEGAGHQDNLYAILKNSRPRGQVTPPPPPPPSLRFEACH